MVLRPTILELDVRHERRKRQEGLFTAEFAKRSDFCVDGATEAVYAAGVRRLGLRASKM